MQPHARVFKNGNQPHGPCRKTEYSHTPACRRTETQLHASMPKCGEAAKQSKGVKRNTAMQLHARKRKCSHTPHSEKGKCSRAHKCRETLMQPRAHTPTIGNVATIPMTACALARPMRKSGMPAPRLMPKNEHAATQLHAEKQQGAT